jgi:hypothetical protein
MAKTAALSLRIEPTLKDALEKAAAAERRPLASYVEIVLSDHIAAKSAPKSPRPDQVEP